MPSDSAALALPSSSSSNPMIASRSLNSDPDIVTRRLPTTAVTFGAVFALSLCESCEGRFAFTCGRVASQLAAGRFLDKLRLLGRVANFCQSVSRACRQRSVFDLLAASTPEVRATSPATDLRLRID